MRTTRRVLLPVAIAVVLHAGGARSSEDAVRIDIDRYDSTGDGNDDMGTGRIIDDSGRTVTDKGADSPIFYIYSKKTDAAGDTVNGRAEFRFDDDFAGYEGGHEFVGRMRVPRWQGGAKGVSVAQTFSKKAGKPLSQLALDADRRFYEVHTKASDDLCGGISASSGDYVWVKIRYHEGRKESQAFVSTGGGAGSSPPAHGSFVGCPAVTSSNRKNKGGLVFDDLYTKIGAYHLNSGEGSVQVKWRNFELYRR